MLTFLLYSLGKVSEIHSITERGKNEQIPTVSLEKYDPDPLIFIVLSLQLNNSKKKEFDAFRVLFTDTHSFFTHFVDILAHSNTFILYLTKYLGFTLNSVILHFFLPHFSFLW